MAIYWIPPPTGVLKINVHATSSRAQSPKGSYTGIGAIYRDDDGVLKHLTLGVIPELTPLGNQIWAIFALLVRAQKLGYKKVILEMDNLEAFLVLKNFHIGAPAGVYDIASQTFIRINDDRWRCMVSYVYPARNMVARYLSRLGKATCDELYTLNRAVGGVEEYLDWDMGMGLDDPNYQDIVIGDEAPDPVNFDVEQLLSDRIDELGLGQVDAPNTVVSVVYDAEVDAAGNMEEVMMEEAIQGGVSREEHVFAGDLIHVEAA